jgi:FkbH-like protein
MTVWKEHIRAADSLSTLQEAVSAITFDKLSSGDVGAIARRLRSLPSTPLIRVAYLGNHTIEPLPDYVGACNLCTGVADAAYVAPYNQYFQMVLDHGSELVAFAPQLIILSLSLRELAPQLVSEFASFGLDALDAERVRIAKHVIDWVEAAKQATQAHMLVCNFSAPTHLQAGIADQKSGLSEQAFYLRLNLELLERLRGEPRAHILDVDRIFAMHGKERVFNPKLYYLARMEWQEGVLPRIAEEINRYVQVLLNRTRKCLVLDLDHTLWGGVIGEDGVQGVKVGMGGPIDEAYFAFQKYLRTLKSRGVILAIASKNNYDDVAELFERRPEMPLKLEDFSALEINWNDKHVSLARIAQTLNIGIDTLAFVDDNPAECSLIKSVLPDVEVIHLAGDPAGFVDLLRSRGSFERLQITAEDRQKTESYLANQKRANLQNAVGDLGSYLKDLATRTIVRVPGEGDVARVHQLFNKTNQFNVATKRYSVADVATFMGNKKFYDLRVIDVSDKFGDLGTVGVILIDRSLNEPHIDSFVMSCRAMGREVETAIMNELKRDYLQSGRAPALTAQYIATKKNKPVERFFEAQGFDVVEERDGAVRTYRLSAAKAATIPCEHISVVSES